MKKEEEDWMTGRLSLGDGGGRGSEGGHEAAAELECSKVCGVKRYA